MVYGRQITIVLVTGANLNQQTSLGVLTLIGQSPGFLFLLVPINQVIDETLASDQGLRPPPPKMSRKRPVGSAQSSGPKDTVNHGSLMLIGGTLW